MKKKKEYILCAANWYPLLDLIYDGMPTTHLRPVNLYQGIIFCGHSHLQCLYQMIAMTGKVQHEVKEVQGFLTSKNRFVDRKEAYDIALKVKQIKEENTYNKENLYSEDLY